MLRALVLDAFSRAGLETIQSLGRHGVIVHASSPFECQAFSSRYVARRWEQPAGGSVGPFLGWLRQIHEEHGYNLIVPCTEHSLRPLTELREDDPLREPLQLAPPESILTSLDKWSTLQLARSCGVPTPPSRLRVSQLDLSPPDSFPVVLKATHSMIPVGDKVQLMQSFLARDYSDWKLMLLSLLARTPVIEQARLTGSGVGIELLYRNGQMVWHFCHRRLHEGSGGAGLGGTSTYRCSVQTPPQLLAHATALLNQLRWHGVAMVEFLETPDGHYYLMEINPRLWGSLALAIDAGVDFPWGLFLMATGQPVPPQIGYRVPYYTRDFANDVRWTLQCLRSQPLRGLWNAMGFARVFIGLESWDHFDWRDLRVTAAGLREWLHKATKSVINHLRKRIDVRRAKQVHGKNLAYFRSHPQACRRILFLCYGNICRSPAAEQMARRLIRGREFASAGFYPESGRSSPADFQRAASILGLDISSLRSQTVSAKMVEETDLIILMDIHNLSDFTQRFPGALRKVLLLGMFLSPPREICDPYNSNPQHAFRVLQQIKKGVEELARELGAAQSLACPPDPSGSLN